MLYSLPNKKMLDFEIVKSTKQFIVHQTLKSVMGCVENNVGQGENDATQHVLLFPLCFERLSVSGLLKVRILR